MNKVVLFLAVFCIILGCAASIKVHIGQPAVGTCQLQVSLINNGNKAITFSKVATPFDEFRSGRSWIVINAQTRDRAEQTGYVAKRKRPNSKDNIRLNPGQSISSTVDLCEFFDFEPNQNYIVQYDDLEQDIKSDAITFKIDTGSVRRRSFSSARRDYKDCTPDQKAAADLAWELYPAFARKAYAAAQNITPEVVYTKWFGAPDLYNGSNDSRYAYVLGVAHDLTMINRSEVRFYCNAPLCSPKTVAYVYRDDPLKVIHLCGNFFKQEVAGFPDSQVGSLYHECSHYLTSGGGTIDNYYGPELCAQGAQQTPDLSVKNADSYEYFGEQINYYPTNKLGTSDDITAYYGSEFDNAPGSGSTEDFTSYDYSLYDTAAGSTPTPTCTATATPSPTPCCQNSDDDDGVSINFYFANMLNGV